MSLLKKLAPIFILTLILPCVALASPLDFVEAHFDGVDGVEGLDGPRYIAVSPDEAHLYVAGEFSNSIAVFARQSDGSLSFVEAVFEGVDGVGGLGGVDAVVVSPDGAHVYTGSTSGAAVSVFARNAATGALTFLEFHTNGVGGVSGLASTVWISISPDGAHIYTSSIGEDTVAVFARDAGTGLLTFVEAQQAGGALVSAHGHVLSPDGAHLYVTGLFTESVAVLARDVATGALTLLETVHDGVNGVTGINTPRGITISPDGAFVYISSLLDSSVAIFARDPATGSLSFSDVVTDGVGDVTGLLRGTAVNMGPNGRRVYVSSFANNSLLIFGRNPDTGGLTQIGLETLGEGGVDGMEGPLIAVPTRDGSVYTLGFFGNSVAVFNLTAVAAVPALSPLAMGTLVVLLAGLALGVLRRRG
jgi:6-phosphogluconolactonase (cycloisomerase 2 family)